MSREILPNSWLVMQMELVSLPLLPNQCNINKSEVASGFVARERVQFSNLTVQNQVFGEGFWAVISIQPSFLCGLHRHGHRLQCYID